MPIRSYSKSSQRLVDGLICAAAWAAAYQIRFEGQVPADVVRQMLLLLLPLAAGQIGVSTLLGIYRFQWRYISSEDALYIARAYLGFFAVPLAIHFMLGNSAGLFNVPGSITAIAFVLSLTGALAARLARRLVYRRTSQACVDGRPRRYLLVGAGRHGAMVATEMLHRNGIEVVGFVDDDPEKAGAVIARVPVVGRSADLPRLVSELRADEVLVCISPKSRPNVEHLERAPGVRIPSRIVPTIDELLQNAQLGATSIALNRPSVTNGTVKPTTSTTQLQIASPAVTTSAAMQLENKVILITGGAGFIGSSLAEKLADKNKLILLDQSFSPASIQYTSLLQHPNVTKIEGSILDIELRSAVKEADIVVHAAAILGVNRVCGAGRETLETNYVGTSRLLKALDASCRIARFVYFSTSEVFGVNSFRVDEASRPSVGPIAESRWSYAMSKLAGEHLVTSYFRETGLPTTIVRPFNIFGPRRLGDYALRRFIVNALKGVPLEIHGDGTQIRSWCYIEDFCSALLQMMVRPEAVGEDFNIGSPGNTLTVFEIGRRIIEITGSSSTIVFCEPPFPDISIRVPSLEKARRLLAYEPKFDLAEALRLTIDWYRHYLHFMPETAVTAAGANARLAA